MNNFSSPFLAKNPLKEKQSLQTKYRKFKAKAGRKIRNFFGESEPTIKPIKKTTTEKHSGQSKMEVLKNIKNK